jgi:hypothetical protein
MNFTLNSRITAYTLVAVAAGTSLSQVIVGKAGDSQFLGQELGQWGALGIFKLKLTRVYDDKHGYNVAAGKTSKHSVIVQCKISDGSWSPDHIVYKIKKSNIHVYIYKTAIR